MPKYKLDIRIKEDDLRAIAKAHQRVVLVKHTAGDKDSSVAWVSFEPWQLNTVYWENTYAIYVSNSKVQSKATINKLSDKVATSGIQYDFANGTFGNPKQADIDIQPNTYYVKHNAENYPALTFGLAQSVVVNGEVKANNPINAVYIPYGQMVSMTPLEKIDVYLLNDITESTVITHVQSLALPVVYGEGKESYTVTYNGKTGQFYIAE